MNSKSLVRSRFVSPLTRNPSHFRTVSLGLQRVQTSWFHYSQALNAIEVHKAERDSLEAPKQNKPAIAVLFGWLLAKSRHLEKYGNLYKCHGADVITCKLEVMEVMRPKEAERVASKILDMLSTPEMKGRPILIHGFSVGGYMYAQVLNKLLTDAKYAEVKSNIKAHIFDSPVDFDGIPHGVSAAAFDNKILRNSFKTVISTYLNLTEKYTAKIYRQRSELFHAPPMKVPSLLLYSLNDPVAASSRVDRLAKLWQEQGISVRQKPWASSPHVSHMYTHTDEYLDEIIQFIGQLGIFDTILDRETLKASI